MQPNGRIAYSYAVVEDARKFGLWANFVKFLLSLWMSYNNDMKREQLANIAIIVLFALLHFGVAVLGRAFNYHDDILLTVLTITMVIILAMRNNIRIDVMAALTLIATLLGYVIGSWLWQPLSNILNNSILAPGFSTFIITLGLGLTIDIITRRSKRMAAHNGAWNTSARNIIGAATSIFVLRLLYFALFSSRFNNEVQLISELSNVMGNTWALLLLLTGNIIIAMRIPTSVFNDKHQYSIVRSIVLSIAILPLLAATITYYNIPAFGHTNFEILHFLRTISAALLIDIIVIVVCFLVRLSTISQKGLREERELKHRSEYQYERLKQQLNPHFLFNSLGILDYLVQEHETERASAFIRKLASTYRYMLNNEEKPLVKLADELEFTNMYVELLEERFTEGLCVEIDVEEDKLGKLIVPCSLQLLVENATKHNIVSSEQPLRIKIYNEGDIIVVRNTLQLRTHGQPSTRLGLANIGQQYRDITGRDISIQKTDNEFIVKLHII